MTGGDDDVKGGNRMSGIYIPGMETPNKKNGAVLIIYPDGKCAFEDGKTYQAITVSDHGRMIDADALSAKLNMMLAMAFGEGNTAYHFAYRSLGKVVENAPTIIPADKEGEG